MPRPEEHPSARRPLEPGEADELARRMGAFATASRLQLLYALGQDEVSVDDLAERAGLGGNATSQQLRVLRDLHLVSSRRDGRRVLYRLHDHHLLDLLGALRHHLEHATKGWSDSVSSARG